jgi:excisionase family DNA binding protein
MSEPDTIKSTGGIAPLGYRWQDGKLIVEKSESSTRKLIYELFIKHKRKKTVAKLLNDLGYRTRNGSLFSDTTIDRLLRDTTAKGIRVENGTEIKVEAIVENDLWERANNLLGQKQTKPPINLFIGVAYCDCGGKMVVPSNAEKYICLECKKKIGIDDLEEIFSSQLGNLENNLADYWGILTDKEKRIIVEQTLHKIIIGKTEINIEFVCKTNSLKTPTFEQHNEKGNESPKIEQKPTLNEPLMNEVQAAKFLGISRMTLLRKRNANEIGFYRVGFRVLYSKEKHLLPFLEGCEK